MIDKPRMTTDQQVALMDKFTELGWMRRYTVKDPDGTERPCWEFTAQGIAALSRQADNDERLN